MVLSGRAMQHSYEGLDPGAGFSRVGLLTPLRHRDFRLLWSGMCISLLGDGVFFVALAWQAYALSDVPSALSIVGIAMTVPTIACLLLGGVISDRTNRRRVMLAADVFRGFVVGGIAALSLTGSLQLWELATLAALYGAATAFFNPSFDAIVPDLLPASDLARANSLDQVIRPLTLRLAGPALGGFLITAVNVSFAFGIDAASFLASALALCAMVVQPVERKDPPTSIVRDLGTGFRYVRSGPWLWATLLSAAAAYLLFMGPTEVLVPFLVKNELHGTAAALGFVFAAGGVGSIGCAVIISQKGLPRRDITWMYAFWTLATLAIAGYGIAHSLWGLMLASLIFNAFETAGTIVWATTKQRLVPPSLLGRVSSLDWLISIGLVPISFAITAPVAAVLGARTTLIGAGVIGACVTAAALMVKGVRDVERRANASAVLG